MEHLRIPSPTAHPDVWLVCKPCRAATYAIFLSASNLSSKADSRLGICADCYEIYIASCLLMPITLPESVAAPKLSDIKQQAARNAKQGEHSF
jgi:hypothetical protein